MPKFSSTDLKSPEGIERVLRQFESALASMNAASVAQAASLKYVESPEFAKAIAPDISLELQSGGSAPISITNLIGGPSSPVMENVHANRATSYPAGNYPVGSLFYETDRTILYVVTVSGGANVWTYATGVSYQALASLPADLGANDSGYLAWTTDYSHLFRWTGSAWTWGPGDAGSGFYQLFEAAPSGYGTLAWQIMDGSTVARANSDGTTSNVTLDDLTTAAYLKGGITSAAVAAASGLVGSTTATNQATTATNQSATTGVTIVDHPSHTHDDASSLASPDLFAEDTTPTGVAGQTGGPSATLTHPVTDPGHNHTQDAHNHTQNAHDHGPGTLELRNKQARMYFRR